MSALEIPSVGDRPKCPNCMTPLRPFVTHTYTRKDHPEGGFSSDKVRDPWAGTYEGYGAFCTLRCCSQFANAAFEAGYRMKAGT